ncbi:MAG TPA: caspase family protein [Bradyrhizobium sp.]|nr:caspase family protein [Bradyrhizobium sp.]
METSGEFRLSGAMARGERHGCFGRFVMNSLCMFFLLAALLLACRPASAEKRVALVIGNSNYKGAAALPNPANDAAAVAQTLKGAGFDLVESKLDLRAADMRRALRDFADQARDADIAIIYYAGHGIEMDGTNYLLPTDAKLERDTDIYDEGFSLDRILLAIEPARLLRLVIVDACRNNPFADAMKRTVSSRSVGRGLARVEPTTTNTLVAFAAKAGFTALDGAASNSPYATALVKYIALPGLDLRKAFGFIRDDVMEATGSRQEPYVYGSLGGADVALVAARPVASTPADAPQSEVRRDLELALQLGNKDALNAFLAQHPDGYYANLARLQLGKIAELPPVAATGKAGLAAEDSKPAVPAQIAEPERRQFATDTPADAQACGKQQGSRKQNGLGRCVRGRSSPRPAGSREQARIAPCSADRRTVAGRPREIGPDRAASRRLSGRSRRWRMGQGIAAFAGVVQQARRHEPGRQACKYRCARCHQAQAGAGLSADLRAWLQVRRRPMQQDRLRRRLLRQ